MPSRRPLGVRFTGSTFEIVPGVLYAGGLPVRLGKPGDAVFTYPRSQTFRRRRRGRVPDLIYVDAWEREVRFISRIRRSRIPASTAPYLHAHADDAADQARAAGLSPELTIESDARQPEVGNALLGSGFAAPSRRPTSSPAADEVAIDHRSAISCSGSRSTTSRARPTTHFDHAQGSSENAAEAYASGAAPPDYKGSDGLRIPRPAQREAARRASGQLPARRSLDAGYPATEPDQTQLPWVRRWDALRADRANASTDWTTANIATARTAASR